MSVKKLKDLKNVGPSTLADLHALGIASIEELAVHDATELFHQLEKQRGHQDPCVWDVFSAIIHEARTGTKTAWWEWTPQRKRMQQDGEWAHSS